MEKMDIEHRIATIVVNVADGSTSMNAASRFADYLMQDSAGYKSEERTEENLVKLGIELIDIKNEVGKALIHVDLLKKQLKKGDKRKKW